MLSITAAVFLTRLASYFPMPCIPAGLSNVLTLYFLWLLYRKLLSSHAASGKSKSTVVM